MLTIFSIPKPFEGHIGIIQRNAIKSWALLDPKPEIILFGDELGTREMADEFNLRHVPDIATNEYGTPLLNDIFDKAQKTASNDSLCYVNADIVLMGDFMQAVEKISALQRFLMVGLRWKVRIDEELDFSSSTWETQLKTMARNHGERESYVNGGEDYFVFNRGLMESIPPFALGRMHWDSWLVYYAKKVGAHLVDATEMVTVVHQNHDYSNLGGVEFSEIFNLPEAKNNFRLLAGGQDCKWYISDADYIVTADGLMRAGLKNRSLVRWIKTHSLVRPYAVYWFMAFRYFVYIFRPGTRPKWNKFDKPGEVLTNHDRDPT